MAVGHSKPKAPARSGVQRAIARAEALLPGIPTPDGEGFDARWGAMIGLSSFIESEPAAVWSFIRRWGTYRQDDLRMAVACCLLEHLLEYHFDAYFPEVERAAVRSKRFADTFCSCSKFGQSEEPRNALRFDQLVRRLRGS